MHPLPRVFVASSMEAERIARAIQQNLTNAEVTVWTQDSFTVGDNTIDGLNRNLQRFDFGVFVFAPDDQIMIRGQKQQTVRDNVIFELGMFMGRLGKERSFIIQPNGVDMRLPTDLLGVVTAKYDRQRAVDEPVAALGSACSQIGDAMKRRQIRKTKELSGVVTDALETICRLMGAPVTPQRAGLRAFIFRRENDDLVCRYYWDPFESSEEVGKTRFRIDPETAKEVVVVRAYLDDEIKTESGSVAPLPKNFSGVKGEIKSTIKYVLAAPIRNEDGTNWGVVDFDATNAAGEKLLRKERIAHAIILRLARHLSGVLAH